MLGFWLVLLAQSQDQLLSLMPDLNHVHLARLLHSVPPRAPFAGDCCVCFLLSERLERLQTQESRKRPRLCGTVWMGCRLEIW